MYLFKLNESLLQSYMCKKVLLFLYFVWCWRSPYPVYMVESLLITCLTKTCPHVTSIEFKPRK